MSLVFCVKHRGVKMSERVESYLVQSGVADGFRDRFPPFGVAVSEVVKTCVRPEYSSILSWQSL